HPQRHLHPPRRRRMTQPRRVLHVIRPQEPRHLLPHVIRLVRHPPRRQLNPQPLPLRRPPPPPHPPHTPPPPPPPSTAPTDSPHPPISLAPSSPTPASFATSASTE